MPEMYPVYESNPEYRAAVLIYDYAVFYKIDEEKNAINVYRVLHSRRNTTVILKNT